MSITASAPSRRLRTTLAAAGLAGAAVAGLGFSAVGAAHAEEMVHIKITVTSNSVPADQTPTVSVEANGTTKCDVAAGATPSLELDVPKGSFVRLTASRACNSITGQGSTGVIASAAAHYVVGV